MGRCPAAAGVGAGAAGGEQYDGGERGQDSQLDDQVSCHGVVIVKTLIAIEPELLAQAQEILGVKTKKDAVNGALREVVRQWAVAEFGELARSGVFDGLLTAEREQPCP